jgi:transcriptional regulator with XRE-family HTH domain
MRRSEARKVLAAYVADRLGRECAERRGAQAEIARALGFSRGHLSNVLRGQYSVGEDLAARLADYWGMTYDQLHAEAEKWGKTSQRPAAVDRPEPWRRLKDRPEWTASLESARAFYKDIPDDYFLRVGAILDDVSRHIDAQFIGEMARVIWSAEVRESAVPPVSVVETTKHSHGKDKKSGGS